jgi:hypothetical protein
MTLARGFDERNIWRRINARERVRVKRVWYWPGQGWTVRAHPIRGGKVLVADEGWFLENFHLERQGMLQ